MTFVRKVSSSEKALESSVFVKAKPNTLMAGSNCLRNDKSFQLH